MHGNLEVINFKSFNLIFEYVCLIKILKYDSGIAELANKYVILAQRSVILIQYNVV
jgi:hypothetical protein